MEFPPQLQTSQTRAKGQGLWLILLAAILLFFTSCDDSQGTIKARYNGGAGEVMIVMNSDLWEAEPGQIIRKHLNQAQGNLPQAEPRLDATQVPKEAFTSFIKHHRNVIVADIADNERNMKTRSEKVESKWANGQLVYTIHALTVEEFIKEFDQVGQAIVDEIVEVERSRLIAYHKVVNDPALSAELDEKMGVSLTIPSDFRQVKSGTHFNSFLRERIMYLSGTGHDVLQGVVVYDYPYQGDSIFTPAYQIAMRDSILGQNVLSSLKDPMHVEMRMPPSSMEKNVVNNFAYEMRGLWRFDKPIMGGPYVSLSMVDEKKNRVITVDGYVFAPKFDKREFLRELEAIAYSLNY